MQQEIHHMTRFTSRLAIATVAFALVASFGPISVVQPAFAAKGAEHGIADHASADKGSTDKGSTDKGSADKGGVDKGGVETGSADTGADK
jgi:hypothetical protein